MKILQVMPQYPWPMVDGGKVGLANIALEYARQGHDVHVAVYHDAAAPRYDPEPLTIHAVDHVPRNTVGRIARSLLLRRSLYTWKHDTPAMAATLDRVIAEQGTDVLHCDHTCMAPLVMAAAKRHGLPWGFRLHNVEWLIWQRYAERFPVWHPARWYLLNQALKVQREEAHALTQADVVFAITPVDRDRALHLAPTANVVVAPAGVDPVHWERERQPTQPPQVVMASNFRWVHNADALRWFLDDVWPAVRQHHQATFHVIGVDVPAWVAEHAVNGVYVDGFVPDLAERYRSASISVAPLFVGSGMRLKIIEAMAAGLPVVATPVSAEGIELFEADGLLRADRAANMATSILGLLRDHELCDRLGRAARKGVADRYTWHASVGLMASTLDGLRTPRE